ncbi:MAG TPA: redoxin domain-containing protein [Mucilaginibacter sp.]|jgi:peroxiredoxin|nr:redoxin domain-containing protein [Mucilaginibacter sp.]
MSEIIPERESSFKTYGVLKPIKAGEAVPDFILEKDNIKWQQFFNGVETHGPVLLRQLLNKPLVIAFYSNYWQAHGLNLLKQLNSIQHEIKAHDTNLLIAAAEKERKLEKIAWENNLSLSFYFDTDKEIAEKFGIYSENDPIWNKFSGIDTNVPLLATYVISPFGKIVYDHIDWDFSHELPSKEIIASVEATKSLILNT